ncbi:MAG: PQQ-binding-like beta-propeller repeat protein [Anaerolineales bacterium]|nr:PQQ-binding-like beta-propeller repeat protein [Anaerolineales bacterium]
MRRPHYLARLLPKSLSVALIASFLVASAPPHVLSPAHPVAVARPTVAHAAEEQPRAGEEGVAVFPPTATPAGSLRFSPVVDADDNPASNPTAATRVPVHRVGAPGDDLAAEAALYAVIGLAVEVKPDDTALNPAGAMVEMTLWDDAGQVRQTRRARADAWGAASAEFFLDDLHLAGTFHYSARADGYGETPPRTFSFDQASYASDVWLGAARLTSLVETDGRLVVDVESDRVIDDSLLAVQLTAVRLLPTESGVPDKTLLPALAARRLDDHHARAEIYLEAGDYLLSATAASGIVEARSQPALVHIAHVDAPPIAAVEQFFEFSEDGESVLVQYRTPDGDVALLPRAVADLPTEAPQPTTPPIFQQQTRVGPFQWRTQVYSTTVETVLDDGKKLATLDDFSYDPIARTYDIKIESLMDQAVEDKLTVQVFGPNRVVIYEETVPIWLDPAQPFHYQFSLPADRGEPYGLRIHVHDPLDFDWALQLISDSVTTVYNALGAAVAGSGVSLPLGLSFSLTAGFGFSIKVVEIDVLTASISCTAGQCKAKAPTGIFFGSAPWLGVVTDGVKTFLRNQYRDILETDDMDKILKKLGEGISLGALTLSATASARLTYDLVDPGSCVSQQALDQAKQYVADLGFAAKELSDTITFRAKDLSEKLQSKGRINLSIPGAWFLGAQLSPVLAFKLKADKSGDYAVYAELQVELGGKATLKLKASAIFDTIFALLEAKDFVIGIYRILDTARTAQKVFAMLSSASAYAAGGGCSSGGGGGGGKHGPNPPPPNGHPDERIDSAQSQFIPDPRGISGDIQTLQQLVSTAQAAGLTRAATYFTVQLRRQEVAAFEMDTSRTISHTAELDAAYDQAYLRVTRLISGTVLPEPGETVTDAVRSTYTDYLIDIAETNYSQERRALLDSLDFALLQYNLLRGQELELQYELRQMLTAGGVGVVDSGLVESAIGAIGSLGVRARPIEIVAGTGSSGLPDSRYLAPFQAPPVVIVPSGGLYRYRASREARAWLETYVATGGTLIVMAQFDSGDWEMLPGGQVRGLGYEQDILCKQASVRIVNSSPWIVGIGRDRPDIQIDGSFTQWPSDATIILMRTTGNQMPAMIEYPYGLGQVVATSAYPDFYMNGLQSTEDIIFARSLFGQAYLQGTGQTPVVSLAPNQTASIPVEVTNTNALSATQITLYQDYYAAALGDSWRWAVHQPNPFGNPGVVSLTPPLPSGASRTVTFNLTAPASAGIYRLGYFMGANTAAGFLWNRSGTMPGVYYQVLSTPVSTDLFRFKLTSDQPAYDFGQTATLTASLFNDRAVARTFTLEARSGLAAAPVQVVVGPHSTATETYTTVVDRTRQVRIAALESGNTVSELLMTVRLKLPTLGLSGTPEEMLAGVAANGAFTATVSNVPVGTTTVDWEVRQNGALLQSTSTPLVGTVGNSLAELAASLPAAPPDTEFTVRVALPNTSRAMTMTIPVLRPVEVRSIFLTDGPVIDDQNADLLLVSLQDPGYPGQYAVQALLKDGSAVLTSSPVVTGASGGSLSYETLDLPLPASLTLGITPTVAISLTGQFDGATDTYSDTFELPLPLAAPQVSLSSATRRAGQPLDITVEALPDNVELPADSPFDVALIGLSTYGYYYLPVESFTPTARGAVLHTHIPPYLYSGGLYDVQVTSWQLGGWESHSNLSVPPHQIDLDAPAAIDAGDTLTATIQNSGGVTATVSGSLVLVDRRKLAVAESSFYLDVPAGGSQPLALTAPEQLHSGVYTLRLQGYDQVSRAVSVRRLVTVNGLAVEVDSRTDQPAYLASDLVSTTSVVTTSNTISGASLRLRVLGTPPPAGDWDGWRAWLADGGRSNYVSQTAAGPFVPTWSAAPQISVAPLAYEDKVILPAGSCAHPQARAVDSLDGSTIWQSPDLPNYPDALAANTNHVYVRTASYCPLAPDAAPDTGNNSLVALDAQTGALVWQTTLNSYDDLMASDAAVLIQDADNNGYLLLDAGNGITRTVLTDVTGALLVDNRVFVREQNTDNLVAYDATTGGQIWSVSAPSDSVLLAANANHVLTFQEYDYSTYDLTNLLSVFDGDGNLLGDVTLTTSPYGPGVVLSNDVLYYLFVDTGGSTRPHTPSDIVSTVYAVDLTGFSESVFYTSEDEITAVVGTGDRLHLVDSYNQTLISLDATGATVGQSDISALGGGNINGLTVHQQGLLALNYGGYEVYALQASGPVYGGEEATRAVNATSVLREDWLTVDGNGVISLPYPLTNPDLGDNPLARGVLYLEAVLFGAEPAAVPQPGNRQRLASSVYPFRLDNAATSVELATDRPAYRRNVPGYSPDDTLSAVTLSGRVRNTGLTSDDITLQIQRSDGALVLSQTFSAVAPNETRPFSAVDPAPPQGAVVYTGTTSLGDSAVAPIQVVPSALTAASMVTPTTLALGEGVSIEVSLANPGGQPAVVTADLGAGPQDVTLAGGEAITLTRALTPSTGGELNLPVVFTGDISRSDTPTTTVRDETASASIVLSGTVRAVAAAPGAHALSSAALVQGADAALDLALQNAQSFSFDVIVDYLLTGPESRSGSQVVTLYPSLTTVHILLGALAAGDYTATVTVRHARLGTVIASAGLSFSVVSPIYDLHIDASAGEMSAGGDILFTVTASSTAASEQPWAGTLVVEDDGDEALRASISLPPGGSATYSQTLSLRDRAGPQTLHAALVGPDGTPLSEHELIIDGPQRLAPAATLTGLTASTGAPGGPVTLTATVDNDGPAGDAPLNFLAFDTTYDVVGVLPAHGSRAVALTVTAPAGLLAGSYPVEVHLGEQSARAEVALTGAQIDLTQALDALSYQPGSQATWTVSLTGASGGPASYDVAMRYVTQSYTQTVTLGAGQTVHVPWTFEVGPAGNRAQVVVSPHVENDEDTTFALIIDSRWVPVIEDPYAWLESDKPSYQAGETVHLTMHLLKPNDAAFVLAPGEIAAAGSPLLWSNLTLTETYTITNPYTVGDFPIDYPLPATLRSGRYHFLYAYDSEERTLPIDVHGVDLFTEDLAVAGPAPGAPLLPGDPLTLTARLRLNAPLASATLLAYAQQPDNTPVDLGPLASQTVSLVAGETPVTLHGVLPASVHSPASALPPGTYRITFQVQDPATLAVLGGDAAYVDVGSAAISSLTTDHGVYAPSAAGTGTLTVYGIDTAHVHVETSGGAVLLDQNVALSGFQAFDFALPTSAIGDEVLIGTVTDSHGLVSTLQAAYKVADDFDVTAPAVQILSPANGARVTLPADHQITVSGVFTEETAIDTVLVNGQAAQISGNTWSTALTATLGSNLIQVVALDAAGNVSPPDLADVTGEIAYGIDFTVAPTTTTVNNVVGYVAVITATEPLTAEVLFPFSVKAVNPVAGSATTGTLSLDLPVSWSGVVTPGEPVTIQWTGQATEPISRTISTLVQGTQMLPRFSQDVPTNITTTPLAVTLDTFQAQLQGDTVLITWTTASELNNAGFNLYRSLDEAGPRDLLAFVPSAAPGSGLGASYEWLDDSLPAAPEIFYWLEAVDFNGTTSLFGPVRVVTLPPTGVRLVDFDATGGTGNGMVGWLAVAVTLLAGVGIARRRRRQTAPE